LTSAGVAAARPLEPTPPESRLFLVLRIAAAMCFIGHGAFGIITKEGWLPYFAVVGIGRDLGYRLMPIIGTIDILLGLSMLIRPTKAALAYMTFWAVWTAMLRPLAGQGVAEFLERAGNYGVPLALLLIGLAAFPEGGWFATLTPQPLGGAGSRTVSWVLRATAALLLLGHGALAVAGKPLLARHLASIGVGNGGASTLTVVATLGGFEIALAIAVLLAPAWPLLLVVFAWKVGTELLFPVTGDHIWEFVERGGSYGAPLAMMILLRATGRM
jgi:hypothetical protein